MPTTLTGYHELPMDDVHESPLNPRKSFNPVKLAELAASIRTKGVLTPLLVRPNADGYEIAAGHRRRRAAESVGLATVPAVIKAMTDEQLLEVLVIENEQRDDLTALEEADGYRLLMTRASYTVERIAERIGMSAKYVYDRVKLLQLVPAAQTLLREDKITAGHAILIARRKPADQTRVIDEGERALWEHQAVLEDVDGDPMADPLKARSVHELEGWIADHIRFVAKAVDPMLFPETAQVLADVAPKEKVVHITYDHHIQNEARDATERTIVPTSWERADGQHGSKTCAHAVLGVVVVGPGRGEAFRVCLAKERCAIHWATWQKERAKRATSTAKPGAKSRKDAYASEREKEKQTHARQEAERLRWKKATPAILDAVAAAVKKAPTKATGLLGQIILGQIRSYNGPRDSADYVPLGTSAEDLVRHAAFIVLHAEARAWTASEHFPKRAKAFGIDVAKILDKEAPTPTAAAATSGSDDKKKSVTKGKKK